MSTENSNTKQPCTIDSVMHCDLPYTNLQLDDIDGEEWVDIYGGYYSVSNMGRIKSNDRLDTKGRKVKGRIRKQCKKPSHTKYKNKKTDSAQLIIVLCHDGAKHTHNVRSLVGEMFLGGKTKRQCYSSINGKWNDNRVVNIEIKTFSESLKLSYKNGRKTRTIKYKYLNKTTGLKYDKNELQNHEDYSYNTVVQACSQNIKRFGTYWERVPHNA